MTTKEMIKADFDENLAYLMGKKTSLNVVFHHKRAGVIGSLTFIHDLAEMNGYGQLTANLIALEKGARGHVEIMFKQAWIHAGRDVAKMQVRFLCDIFTGYNAARTHYKDRYQGSKIPGKININQCKHSPKLNKSIAKVIGAIAE